VVELSREYHTLCGYENLGCFDKPSVIATINGKEEFRWKIVEQRTELREAKAPGDLGKIAGL